MVYVGDKLTTLPSGELIQRQHERSGSIWDWLSKQAIVPSEKEEQCGASATPLNSSRATSVGLL
jgi:hypothetical protein